jgi:hypothetical protein
MAPQSEKRPPNNQSKQRAHGESTLLATGPAVWKIPAPTIVPTETDVASNHVSCRRGTWDTKDDSDSFNRFALNLQEMEELHSSLPSNGWPSLSIQ